VGAWDQAVTGHGFGYGMRRVTVLRKDGSQSVHAGCAEDIQALRGFFCPAA